MNWSLIDVAWLVVAAFGCGYAILLAASLLSGPARRSQASIFIALFWFSISMWMFITAFAVLGILDLYPGFRFVQIPPAYATGPALWLHFRAVNHAVRAGTIRLHFLPVVVSLLFLLPLYFGPSDYKDDLDRRVHDLSWSEFLDTTTTLYMPWWYDRIAYFVLTLPKIFFPAYIAKLLVERFYVNEESRVIRILSWILGSWMLAMLGALIYQFWPQNVFYRVALPLAMAGAVALFLMRHSYGHIAAMIEGRTPRGKSKLAGLDTVATLRRLDALMTADCLYREPGLTIGMVADQLDISPHQLSELLNQVRKTTFVNYVNGYRIAEARELLAQASPRNVLNIALDVGFNSKATFNRAFRRLTGLSPREYRSRSRAAGPAADNPTGSA
jgi:AraC-like DNA-binding protein